MSDLNKAMLIGNVGKDPETFTTEGGLQITRFTLATNAVWQGSNGEKKERTAWHTIVAFSKLAEVIQKYVKKGKKIYVEGEINYRMVGDGVDKKYFTEINLKEFSFLDSKRQEGESFP